jgi:hypothetical protein
MTQVLISATHALQRLNWDIKKKLAALHCACSFSGTCNSVKEPHTSIREHERSLTIDMQGEKVAGEVPHPMNHLLTNIINNLFRIGTPNICVDHKSKLSIVKKSKSSHPPKNSPVLPTLSPPGVFKTDSFF